MSNHQQARQENGTPPGTHDPAGSEDGTQKCHGVIRATTIVKPDSGRESIIEMGSESLRP
jgi:hypothetical protein